MSESMVMFTFSVFILTILFIMWRPRGMNEAIPTAVGALFILAIGVVPFTEVWEIFDIVSGPALTIVATIIMCLVLESIGVFHWAALNLIRKANGSGIRLFWYILLMCFFMTVFFNNDGSILITTPIIIHIVSLLHLKKHQKLPYLFGGVFVATAASLPIGVSNIANLIGLEVVGLNLNSYTAIVFVPAMIGILTLGFLLYLYFHKEIPKTITNLQWGTYDPITSPDNPYQAMHPLANPPASSTDWFLFRVCIGIVVFIRSSYFLLTPYGIEIEWIAIIGALGLVMIRWLRQGVGAYDVIKKAPWHILVFAFGMYVIVYGLSNTGLTEVLVDELRDPVSTDLLSASLIMGMLLTVMSNVMNNLPSVMLGTMMITQMGLDVQTLQVAYIALIIGSDIGALLTPIGTLATLLWLFVLKSHGIHVSWLKYFKVSIMVIPISLLITLLSLYVWVSWML